MIFVRRPDAPESLSLDDDQSAAAKELVAAINHFKERNSPIPVDTFKAYAAPEVRDKLKLMFFGKCAYCESQAAGSSQTDVEHYRPKGSVTDKPGHPGYWWLAMVWSNLVLSCMHCNQSRKQLLFSIDMTDAEIRQAIKDKRVSTVGKLNSFPTEDGNWVTDWSQTTVNERPLLLDPTITDPEPLLTWASRGNFAMVGPKNGNKRAKITILTLGLNRRHLCEERMTKLSELSLNLEHIRAAIADMQAATTEDGARIAMRAALRDLEKLKGLCDASQSHSALARDFLKQARKLIADTKL